MSAARAAEAMGPVDLLLPPGRPEPDATAYGLFAGTGHRMVIRADRDSKVWDAARPGEFGFDALGRSGWAPDDERCLTQEIRRAWTDRQIPLAFVVRRLPDFVAGLAGGGDDPGGRWRCLARLVVAAADVAADRAALGDTEAALNAPLLTRLRFLVLTMPFRLPIASDSVDSAFDGGRDETVWRARRARSAWFSLLSQYEDHPVLVSRLGPGDLEADARLMIFESPAPSCSGSRPRCAPGPLLTLTSSRLDLRRPYPERWKGDDPHLTADRRFVRHASRTLFLHRFMLREAWMVSALVRTPDAAWRAFAVAPALLLGAVAVLPVAFVVRPSLFCLPLLFWSAVAAYGLIGIGVLTRGSAISDAHCLRFAAGAGIGMVALISISAAMWWEKDQGWWLAGAMAVAAFGYLLVEIEAHGAPARSRPDSRSPAADALATAWSPIVQRAALTLVVGWAHAVAVAALMLHLAAPVFFEKSYVASGAPGVRGLVVAAGTGLALGVFLQMLWEDRPVTYPLAHMDWRERR